jgi:hypothetical protein
LHGRRGVRFAFALLCVIANNTDKDPQETDLRVFSRSDRKNTRPLFDIRSFCGGLAAPASAVVIAQPTRCSYFY